MITYDQNFSRISVIFWVLSVIINNSALTVQWPCNYSCITMPFKMISLRTIFTPMVIASENNSQLPNKSLHLFLEIINPNAFVLHLKTVKADSWWINAATVPWTDRLRNWHLNWNHDPEYWMRTMWLGTNQNKVLIGTSNLSYSFPNTRLTQNSATSQIISPSYPNCLELCQDYLEMSFSWPMGSC